MIRIVIHEKRRLLREGMALVLTEEAGAEIVGAVDDLDQVVGLLHDVPAEAVVVDLDSVNDWQQLEKVRMLAPAPGCRIVGVTSRATTDRIELAQSFGVDQVVDRDRGTGAVVEAVTDHACVSGRTHRLGEAGGARRDRLSGGEVAVLRLLARGSTTREVAKVLAVSPKTVENHKQRIFAKLSANNAAHAVAVALRLGLLAPPVEYAAVGN